jgi:uncharacterized membrane protein YoaK (UPF0700 family)
MQIHPAPPDRWVSFGLAFVGGYGDAAGFILAKAFTGHVTGSLVLAAISIADCDWRGSIARLSAVLSFSLGILVSIAIARLLATRPLWPVLPTALGTEMILIVAAYMALALHVTAKIEIFVICLSLALGLQNGAFRHTGGINVHTNYMTGMLTTLITGEASKYISEAPPPLTARSDPKLRLLCGMWMAFVLGAGAGAEMVLHFKELGILGAILLLFAVIINALISGSRGEPAAS